MAITIIEWKSVKGLEWFKIDNELFDLLVGQWILIIKEKIICIKQQLEKDLRDNLIDLM